MKTLDDALKEGRRLGSSLVLSIPGRIVTGMAGERLGSRTGSSMEFQDYREYQPGDDIRRLDWAAYARSDKLTLRLHREEVQPRLDLISDCSSSMTAPDKTKSLASVFLAGLLAEASLRAGISMAWWSFGGGWRKMFSSSGSFPDGVLPEFGGPQNIEDEFSRAVPPFSRCGIRICISDFLWEVPPEIPLRRLSEGASSVMLLNILSGEEIDPPLYGPAALTDAETGRKLDSVIGPAEKKAYLKKLESHVEMWEDACTVHGCLFCRLKAESLLEGDVSALISSGMLS